MTDLVPLPPPEARKSSIELAPSVWPIAEKIASTDFVPKALRGKPEAVLACILAGHEAGISPMQALAKIHIIEGRPAMAAELMRALVLSHGHELDYPELSSTVVVARGRRRGKDGWTKIEWTLDDAKRAGIAGKDVWRRYPRSMLQARATAELCRLIFPDVLAGISYAIEELTDDPEVINLGRAEAVGTGAPTAPPATARARRRATRSTASPDAEPRPAPESAVPDLPDAPSGEAPNPPPAPEPAPSPDPPAEEGEPTDAELVDEPAAAVEPDDGPEPEEADVVEPWPDGDWPEGDWPTNPPSVDAAGPRYTGPQLIAIRIAELFDVKGASAEARARRLSIISALLERPVASSKDLAPEETGLVLDLLRDWPEGEPAPDEPSKTAPAAPPESTERPDLPPVAREEAPAAPVAPPKPASGRREAVTDPEDWPADRWRTFLTSRKVKVTEAMRQVTKLGAALDPPVTIPTLDDVAGKGIAGDLVGWIEDTAQERGAR